MRDRNLVIAPSSILLPGARPDPGWARRAGFCDNAARKRHVVVRVCLAVFGGDQPRRRVAPGKQVTGLQRFVMKFLAGSLAILGMTASTAPAQLLWKAEKSVEIIVGAGPGGGQDRSARAIQGTIQKNKLINMPTQVSNKPGAGSALALAYLVQRRSDPHVLQLLTSSLITNHVTGKSPHTHTEVTPIAILFDEYIACTVSSASPVKNGKELLDRLRADPAAVSFGISGRGTGSHLAMAMLAREAGVDPARMKFVVFKSGSMSLAAVLGGHVDAMLSTVSPVANAAEAGQVRIVGVTASRRLSGQLANVPTWRDMGYQTEFSNWRAIVAPPGLTESQIGFWDGVFDKLVKTADFTADVEENYAVPNYRNSAATTQFLRAKYPVLKQALADVGMAKD